jgi:TRAP-type C4-dicarboxylate transport system substrate-binding protein
MVLYSKTLFDRLSGEEQKALFDCAADGQQEQRKISRALGEQSLANLQKQGMRINLIAPEQQARMREAVKPVYERAKPVVGAETVDRMNAALAKIRGTN